MLFEAELRSVLIHVAGVAASGCGALFLLDVALCALARTGRGTRAASLRHLSPPLVRHGAELVVTALFALGAARPAGASVTPVRDWLRRPATTTTVPTTTPTATTPPTVPPPPATVPAPSNAPAPAPPPRPLARPAPADRYVVAPDDCLWRIAARHLGPGATNQTIDSAWRAIYAANRAAVGDDPNLIHPGLVLTLPPLAAAH